MVFSSQSRSHSFGHQILILCEPRRPICIFNTILKMVELSLLNHAGSYYLTITPRAGKGSKSIAYEASAEERGQEPKITGNK